MKSKTSLMLSGVFVAAFSGAVLADPAVIIDDQFCLVIDGNGNLTNTNDSKVIATQSKNGNAVWKCKAMVPNDTGMAARWDSENNPFFSGVACNIPTPFGNKETTDWKITVSSEGDATATCRFNGDL